MSILGSILKKGIVIRQSLEQKYSYPFDLQKAELKKLLITAKNTRFGEFYDFEKILKSFKSRNSKDFYQSYRENIPIFDYDSLFESWWHLSRFGHKDICWPGKIKYFAMSSGTSGDSSKYIPVSKDMIKAIRRSGMRQLLTLAHYDLPEDVFNKGILMLGGSTNLKKAQSFYDGDLSGITTSKIPFWLEYFYKPGKKISQLQEWGDKLEEITKKAKDWDIGFVVGVPAWIQLMFEKIIDHYGLENIHDIWPNLSVYVHGGVAFDPYKKGFEKLLGRPMHYIETYLASEGFIAFQANAESKGMRLILNNGIFYEFIPFDKKNFTSEGAIKENAQTCLIDEVEEGKEYAILLTTCAGTWRYLIGDVVKFTNKENAEIIITGRTKHFLSLCGEHLSVDNMNQAIKMVENELNISIREFTVAGTTFYSGFAHRWYIGCDNEIDQETLKMSLDAALKKVNDDYAVERSYALKEIFVEILPSDTFYNFMRLKGKEGAQNKFPRVVKDEKLREWEEFLEHHYQL